MQYKQVVGLLTISASLASCTLFKSSCQSGDMKRVAVRDSSTVIFSDSIDSIVLNVSKIRLYDMASFVASSDSTTDKHDRLFNYTVKKNMGLLKKGQKDILHFIISDKNWYIKDYAPIRQPFHPNIAMEFIYKRSKVFMFVSFGTEEIGIATSDGKFKFYLMRDKRPMVRWTTMMFPEEEYYKNHLK